MLPAPMLPAPRVVGWGVRVAIRSEASEAPREKLFLCPDVALALQKGRPVTILMIATERLHGAIQQHEDLSSA